MKQTRLLRVSEACLLLRIVKTCFGVFDSSQFPILRGNLHPGVMAAVVVFTFCKNIKC